MKDNTNKVKNIDNKEMLIYEGAGKAEGINLVDVYHLITTQIQTINAQSKVITLLEENNNLKDKVKKLSDSIDYLQEELEAVPGAYAYESEYTED